MSRLIEFARETIQNYLSLIILFVEGPTHLQTII